MIICIQRTGFDNQEFGEIASDAPVAAFVGSCQCRKSHHFSKTKMIEFAALRAEAYDNIAQALPERQLPEGHRRELFPTGEVLDAIVTHIPLYALIELITNNRIHDLRKDVFSVVHNDN